MFDLRISGIFFMSMILFLVLVGSTTKTIKTARPFVSFLVAYSFGPTPYTICEPVFWAPKSINSLLESVRKWGKKRN